MTISQILPILNSDRPELFFPFPKKNGRMVATDAVRSIRHTGCPVKLLHCSEAHRHRCVHFSCPQGITRTICILMWASASIINYQH